MTNEDNEVFTPVGNARRKLMAANAHENPSHMLAAALDALLRGTSGTYCTEREQAIAALQLFKEHCRLPSKDSLVARAEEQQPENVGKWDASEWRVGIVTQDSWSGLGKTFAAGEAILFRATSPDNKTYLAYHFYHKMNVRLPANIVRDPLTYEAP
jgi:hypothetical protein